MKAFCSVSLLLRCISLLFGSFIVCLGKMGKLISLRNITLKIIKFFQDSRVIEEIGRKVKSIHQIKYKEIYNNDIINDICYTHQYQNNEKENQFLF